MKLSNDQLFWLAGLLEGEGSFLKGPPSAPHQPRVCLSMTDEDIIQRVAALWQVKYHPSGQKRGIEKQWRPAFSVMLKGSRAVQLMQQLRSIMGQRRQFQIDVAIACYECLPHPTTRLNAQSVSEIKERLKEHSNVKALASEYGVNVSTIYQIKWGKSWDWVE